MRVKEQLQLRAARIESYLQLCLKEKNIPKALLEAMEYSLLAGGKRLRPVLTLAFSGMFGTGEEKILPFAAGIECIHTYSLIHDDLPAMDDDDLRRGRLSSHKKFDEATAILAGDALLTEAFALMTSPALVLELEAHNVLGAIQELARAAGAAGMVGGQLLDMDFTAREDIDLSALQSMHSLKTGAMIKAACLCGAILAGANEEQMQAATVYGSNIGVAFQIVDDILDLVGNEAELGKPVGSDIKQNKSTYPKLLGLEQSHAMADVFITQATEAIADYTGEDALFLKALARYIVERVH